LAQAMSAHLPAHSACCSRPQSLRCIFRMEGPLRREVVGHLNLMDTVRLSCADRALGRAPWPCHRGLMRCMPRAREVSRGEAASLVDRLRRPAAVWASLDLEAGARDAAAREVCAAADEGAHRAAVAISYLAGDSSLECYDNGDALADGGVLDPLLRQAGSADGRMQCSAVWALASVLRGWRWARKFGGPEKRTPPELRRAVALLVASPASTDAVVRPRVAQALGTVLRCERLRRGGGMDVGAALAWLVRSARDGAEDAQLEALDSLCSDRNPCLAAGLASAGGLEVLAEAMRDVGRSRMCRISAARPVAHAVAHDASHLRAFVSAGGLDTTIALARELLRNRDEIDPMAALVAHLARDFTANAVAAGVIPALVNLIFAGVREDEALSYVRDALGEIDVALWRDAITAECVPFLVRKASAKSEHAKFLLWDLAMMDAGVQGRIMDAGYRRIPCPVHCGSHERWHCVPDCQQLAGPT